MRLSRRHSAASGPGAGVHPQAARLHVHQEGAELAGRPDARVEEEETGGCATRGATALARRLAADVESRKKNQMNE